jgi:C4-dicarboxylate-specific signal transduction histidine kinase
MFLGQPVIVRDVLEDPRWEDYRDLAIAHGLRACWSTPIMSQQGKVLGSFAMYYREPRNPTAEEVRLIEIATQLAAIAIERKHTEREIDEQRRELAHLGRAAMLGEISGALAHELMQPLTAVLTNAQVAQRLMARTPPDISEMPDILSDIVAAERRASDVIHRLRTMLAKGQTQLVPVDLNEVITDTLKLARSEFTAREVTFVRRTPQDLPPVLGDRVQLQQVLLNLIINACDAMANTEVMDRRISLTAAVSADERTLRLAITDRGSGVPRELLDRIFDPFITSKEHGLGLGLSICRSIMRAHGGQLTVVNNPERGATFSFSLPVMVSVPA